jgi:hypothetical protein
LLGYLSNVGGIGGEKRCQPYLAFQRFSNGCPM